MMKRMLLRHSGRNQLNFRDVTALGSINHSESLSPTLVQMKVTTVHRRGNPKKGSDVVGGGHRYR